MSCFECTHHTTVPAYMARGGKVNALTVEVGGRYGYPNDSCRGAQYLAVAGQHVCLLQRTTFYTARGEGECRHEDSD